MVESSTESWSILFREGKATAKKNPRLKRTESSYGGVGDRRFRPDGRTLGPRLRLGGGAGGVGVDGAGGSEGVDVRLALDAVALVLLQALPQRIHVTRRHLLLIPSTAGAAAYSVHRRRRRFGLRVWSPEEKRERDRRARSRVSIKAQHVSSPEYTKCWEYALASVIRYCTSK